MLSYLRAFVLSVMAAGAGLAIAQPPPSPPGGGPGGGSLPPFKQKQTSDQDGDRRDQPRPRRAGAPLPTMNGVEMPEMESVTEEPVTASGNIELWRARIAERRARLNAAATSNGGSPR
jgi:hypothetical protein